jgi:hypothetical protein
MTSVSRQPMLIVKNYADLGRVQIVSRGERQYSLIKRAVSFKDSRAHTSAASKTFFSGVVDFTLTVHAARRERAFARYEMSNMRMR